METAFPQHSKIDSPPGKTQPVVWVGPSGDMWEWIHANLEIFEVNQSLERSTLKAHDSPSSPLDITDASQLGRYLQKAQSRILTAVDGRLDPTLDRFLRCREVWASAQTAMETAGPGRKATAKSKRSKSQGIVGQETDSTSIPAGLSEQELRSIFSGDFSDHFALILGDFWPGHRRTRPLPEELNTFYWYELFDKVLPWTRGAFSDEVTSSANSTMATSGKGKASKLSKQLQPTDSAAQTARQHPAQQRGGRTNARVERTLRNSQRFLQNRSDKSPLRHAQILLLSDMHTTTRTWEELLGGQQARLIISQVEQLHFRASPDVVIIDVPSPPRYKHIKIGPAGATAEMIDFLHRQAKRSSPSSHSAPPMQPASEIHIQSNLGCQNYELVDANLAKCISRTRSLYPEALVVAIDSFPRWKAWECYLSLGADLLIPRPFHWPGLLWCLEHWLISSSQVRINSV